MKIALLYVWNAIVDMFLCLLKLKVYSQFINAIIKL